MGKFVFAGLSDIALYIGLTVAIIVLILLAVRDSQHGLGATRGVLSAVWFGGSLLLFKINPFLLGIPIVLGIIVGIIDFLAFDRGWKMKNWSGPVLESGVAAAGGAIAGLMVGWTILRGGGIILAIIS